MSLPTIFFSTSTGSNSQHAACIRRVCTEINTPSFSSQFKTISCITDNSLEILQQVQVYREGIAFFHFGGRDEHFQALLHTSLSAGFGSLAKYLADLPQLDLIFLSYCSRNVFVEPLLQAGIEAVVSTSRHLPQEQAIGFAAVFYQQFLLYGQTTQVAYNQASKQVGIQPGNQERQFAGLHGNPRLRLRRWWEEGDFESKQRSTSAPRPQKMDEPSSDFEVKPRIIGTAEPRIVGEQPANTATLPSLPATRQLPVVPFPGAQPYRRKHAGVFFGRETELLALYNQIATAERQPITLLVGQAGVGKSSLLKAGLLPHLKQRYTLWSLNGGKAPYLFETLCQHIKPRDRTTITKRDWTTWLAKQDWDLLLIVDQFETQLLSKNPKLQADLAQFMQAIHALISGPASPNRPRVIFSVREENLVHCKELLAQHHLQSQTHEFLLKPLKENGIRSVLHSFAPSSTLATHYQFSIEDNVAERIVTDLTQDPNSPIAPFLQAILVKLWEEATNASDPSRQLSLQRYQQLYGDGTLLRNFLDARLLEVRDLWPPIHYKKLITLLVTYTSLAATARARVATAKDSTQRVTTRLKEFHLLTEKADQQGNELQLSHKLLELPISQAFYRLTSDAPRFKRQKDDLAFVTSYIKAWAVRQSAQAKQQNKYVTTPFFDWLNRRVKITRGLFFLFTLGMLGLLLFLYWPIQSALQQIAFATNRGEQQTPDPRSNLNVNDTLSANSTTELIGNTGPVPRGAEIELKRVSLLYAYDALPATYVKQRGSVLAFSSNSALLFAGGGDNTLEIWSVAEAQPHPSLLVPTPSTALTTITIQDNLLVYTTEDGGVGHFRLDALGHIEPSQRHESMELLRHNGIVTAVQISADGNLLVTGGQDGAIHHYDMQTNQLYTLRNEPADPITAIALHPNKQMVAYVGANPVISIWDRTTGTVSHQMAGHTGHVNSLEFSRDGSRILSAASDGAVCLWQLANATREYCFVDLTASANIARYSPDGAMIIAARNDGYIQVWDAVTYRLLDAVEAHSGGVSALAIRADGRQLASAGWDSRIVLWDMSLPLRSLQ